MNLLKNTDIPKDYHYYRSHSKIYFSWILKNLSQKTITIEENGNYWYINHFFWWMFSIARFEKSEIIPTLEIMKKYKMKRGLVLWSWWSKLTPGILGNWLWFKLWYFFSWTYHHSVRCAFSVLDGKDYWKKWKKNEQGSRYKVLKEVETWKVVISTKASLEDFVEVYEKTKLKHALKNYLISRQRFISEIWWEKVRVYLAYVDSKPLAWAIFLDDFPTSTYLVAFQDNLWKKYHLWLAIIDKWFEESEKSWFKYLDLDHMKWFLDSSSYAWYTKFKSSIADYELNFPNMWVWIIL